MHQKLKTIIVCSFLSACAMNNVSIRNYSTRLNENKFQENERTIVGSFEVIQSDTKEPIPSCKITFLLSDGKTTRRYFQQNEDQGLVITWANPGKTLIQGIDCGDGSFGIRFDDKTNKVPLSFDVDTRNKTTYFGHLSIEVDFSGMSDASGVALGGTLGMAIASGSRSSKLKNIKIEDRWTKNQDTFQKLVPTENTKLVTKNIVRRN